MDITWYGGRCFSIRGKDATVVTDPTDEVFSRLPKNVVPKVVTFSRSNAVMEVPSGEDGYPRVIRRPGEYEVADVLITGIATRNQLLGGEEPGKNILYAIGAEELVLCHLGGLQSPLTEAQVQRMGVVRVLMAPIGDQASLRASMETISLLEPGIVIPMDYNTGSVEGEDSSQTLTRFLKEMSAKEVEPQRRVQVSASSMPAQTQVAILEKQS